jgi:hypothetical protein
MHIGKFQQWPVSNAVSMVRRKCNLRSSQLQKFILSAFCSKSSRRWNQKSKSFFTVITPTDQRIFEGKLKLFCRSAKNLHFTIYEKFSAHLAWSLQKLQPRIVKCLSVVWSIVEPHQFASKLLLLAVTFFFFTRGSLYTIYCRLYPIISRQQSFVCTGMVT